MPGMKRKAYSTRGPIYTHYATAIRCSANDEHTSTVRIHYTSNGSARLVFVHRRKEYFVPAGIILHALAEFSDSVVHAIVARGLSGLGAQVFAIERIRIILGEAATFGIHNKVQALAYLGEHLRAQLDANPWETNFDVGKRLICEHIFIHLQSDEDKFNLVLLMMQKLYALVAGQCSADNPDSLMHHEILLPGILMQIFVREKLQDALHKAKIALNREFEENPNHASADDGEWLSQVAIEAITKTNIGRLAEYFLATGNLSSRTGLGLTQTSGFTIVADKLNYMVGKTSSCQNNVLSINRCKSHSASFSADPTSCVTFHTFDQFTVVLISQSFEQRLFGNYCQSHGAFYALCILLMVAHVDY